MEVSGANLELDDPAGVAGAAKRALEHRPVAGQPFEQLDDRAGPSQRPAGKSAREHRVAIEQGRESPIVANVAVVERRAVGCRKPLEASEGACAAAVEVGERRQEAQVGEVLRKVSLKACERTVGESLNTSGFPFTLSASSFTIWSCQRGELRTADLCSAYAASFAKPANQIKTLTSSRTGKAGNVFGLVSVTK